MMFPSRSAYSRQGDYVGSRKTTCVILDLFQWACAESAVGPYTYFLTKLNINPVLENLEFISVESGKFRHH